MLFNSLEFLLFAPIVLLLFWVVPQHYRRWVLLASSIWFYLAWIPQYSLVLLSSIITDFIASNGISTSNSRLRRKFYLWLSLIINLGLLGYFKYSNFFLDIIQLPEDYRNSIGYLLPTLLPLGISFYTFQSLAYTIDVYRGEIKPEKSFLKFITYVSFFPQMIAGPIERAKDLLPQINKAKPNFLPETVQFALYRISLGFFKKVVIADRIAFYVDAVYDNPLGFNGLQILIASLFFMIQIYCDFSGYCDIAIGLARFFGIQLTENFNRPYTALNLKEFWSKWHITLSRWFRDYVYIPLGGNRKGAKLHILFLLITFLVSGLWHGAHMNFIIWGGIHGVVAVSQSYITFPKFIPNWVKWSVTQSIVFLAWIWFRADTTEKAMVISKSILNVEFLKWLNPLGHEFGIYSMFISFVMVVFLFTIEWKEPNTKSKYWIITSFLITCILLFGNFVDRSFIYFQF